MTKTWFKVRPQSSLKILIMHGRFSLWTSGCIVAASEKNNRRDRVHLAASSSTLTFSSTTAAAAAKPCGANTYTQCLHLSPVGVALATDMYGSATLHHSASTSGTASQPAGSTLANKHPLPFWHVCIPQVAPWLSKQPNHPREEFFCGFDRSPGWMP